MKPYYSRGGIEIYNADCREMLGGGISADLLVTDPPYGIGAARSSFCSGTAKRPKGFYPDLHWDDKPVTDELLTLARAACPTQIIFGANYFSLPPARCFLIWDKLRPAGVGYADAEVAWTNLDRSVRILRWLSNGFQQREKEARMHPTQKPVGVMRWAIEQAPRHCCSILDPFAGSGSTLIAARHLGRRAIGIEIEERYCEMAAKRLDAPQIKDKTWAAQAPADAPHR